METVTAIVGGIAAGWVIGWVIGIAAFEMFGGKR